MTLRETELARQLSECQEALQQSRRENELLRQKLDALARRLFGVSSEALNPAQLQLLLQLPELAAQPVITTPVANAVEKRSLVRKLRAPRLPEHLPVVEEVIEPEPVKQTPADWRCIGQEVSEQLDYEPARFLRRRTIRKKYVHRTEVDAVPVIAPLPERLRDRSLPAAGLLAHILVSKYCDHLPLYRQEQIYAQRHQVQLPRQTLARWVALAAEWLQPIYEQIRTGVMAGGYEQVLEEWTSAGGTTNLAKVYNYGVDLISQRVPNTSTNYFIFDGHGSTRMLTDNGGNFVNAFAYDAYGTLITSNSSPQTLYLYCGQQYDSDLGLYYNRARYLNPNTGRFWTMDTYQGNTEDPLSLHKYLYAQDNPVDNDDPLGLYTQGEGYAVEKLIRDQYAIDHGGDDVNRTGGPIGVGKNPALKPDIWNKSSDPKSFAEIKPLSLSGIADGITQLNKYEDSLKGLLYVRDKWPTSPSVRTCYVNYQPYFYFNIHGLILYTVIEPPPILPIVLKDAKTLAEQQAEQLLKQGATTLTKVVGERAILVGEAGSAEFEEDAIEAF